LTFLGPLFKWPRKAKRLPGIICPMDTRQKFRMALLGEGIYLPETTTIGEVRITRPDLRIGQENLDTLQQLLDQANFGHTIDRPTWMASAATGRPLYFATTSWLEADTAPLAHILLTKTVYTLADVLSLAFGGEPRTIGYVLQMQMPSQEPRTISVAVGGPARSTSQLQRLKPDSVSLPTINIQELYDSLVERPRVALWAHLFAPIAGEQRWELRALRLTSLLEGIARETTPSNIKLTLPDGTPLTDRNNKPAKTDTLRGRLYHLVEQACLGMGIPERTVIATPHETLWSESGIWADLRNVIAHDGRWLAAPSWSALATERDRCEAAATLASLGGSLEEGLIRYADSLTAAAELVLRYASGGGFDSNVVR